MEYIFKQLEGLKQLSGNAQISYLMSIKSALLKEVLKFTYDPHMKYKVDTKLDKFQPSIGPLSFTEISWQEFKKYLNYFNNKASATDEEVAKLSLFLSEFNLEGQNFCKQVLTKDLRLNMAIKKFQKVWPDFCVEPQVQLAQSKDNRADFVNGVYSRKFDGKRVYILDGIPYSRSNKECSIPPMRHILNQLTNSDKWNELQNWVLDGECLYFENGIENFQKGISLCQRDERAEGCDNIYYVIFDVINKNNFLSKTPYIPFKNIYNELIDKIADIEKSSPCYSLIPTVFDNIYIARQDSDASELIKLCKQNNWEGLMYRDADSCYEYKRSNKLLKIKQMQDIELKLIDMEEGTGKHEGRLGAFIVEYDNTTVRIGSGFSDELRSEYWYNKDKYIGQMVKVQYFEKTVAADGTPSLRFPVFLSFRDINTTEEFLKL